MTSRASAEKQFTLYHFILATFEVQLTKTMANDEEFGEIPPLKPLISSPDPTGAREQLSQINAIYQEAITSVHTAEEKNTILTTYLEEIMMVNSLLLKTVEDLLVDSDTAVTDAEKNVKKSTAATQAAEQCLEKFEQDINNIQGKYNVSLSKLLELEHSARILGDKIAHLERNNENLHWDVSSLINVMGRAYSTGQWSFDDVIFEELEIDDILNFMKHKGGHICSNESTNSDMCSSKFVTPPQSINSSVLKDETSGITSAQPETKFINDKIITKSYRRPTSETMNSNSRIEKQQKSSHITRHAKYQEELLMKDKIIFSLQRTSNALNQLIKEQEYRISNINASKQELALQNSRLSHKIIYLQNLCQEIKKEIFNTVI